MGQVETRGQVFVVWTCPVCENVYHGLRPSLMEKYSHQDFELDWAVVTTILERGLCEGLILEGELSLDWEPSGHSVCIRIDGKDVNLADAIVAQFKPEQLMPSGNYYPGYALVTVHMLTGRKPNVKTNEPE